MSRYFLAVDFDNEIREKINRIVKNYQKSEEQSYHHQIRWIPNSNWHLTLAFLGHVDASKVTQLSLDLKLLKNKKCSLNFTKCEVFPARKPSVIALRAQANESINQLKEDINSVLRGLGITHSDKKLLPHISIARIKSGINLAPQDINLRLQLTNITLFKSLPSHKGVRYECLERVEL